MITIQQILQYLDSDYSSRETQLFLNQFEIEFLLDIFENSIEIFKKSCLCGECDICHKINPVLKALEKMRIKISQAEQELIEECLR